jgi:hypothetical protein
VPREGGCLLDGGTWQPPGSLKRPGVGWVGEGVVGHAPAVACALIELSTG